MEKQYVTSTGYELDNIFLEQIEQLSKNKTITIFESCEIASNCLLPWGSINNTIKL